MKTEDGGPDDFGLSLPPPPPPPSPLDGNGIGNGNGSTENAVPGTALTPTPTRRTVCDHCRRRRIRCDGQLPCQPCINAALVCKRDHVPLKRGPKRGRGRVINELRERYSIDNGVSKRSRESSIDLTGNLPSSVTISIPPTPAPPSDISWQNVSSDPRHAAEPRGAFSTEQYRPTSRSYMDLIPRCVDLYYEHIYPIMPLPYMPALHAMLARLSPSMADLSWSDRNYLYALSALTCFHMSGQNVAADAPTPSWESAGRFFLDECIAARQSYDFFGDVSLHAVISSFWLSTSFFEINQSRKSWLYLREALTLAQDLELHGDASYVGLDPAEQLCRQRTFWQLFVTERSFAILRSKPITLKKTPSLPTTRHAYEAPDIHSGFLQLISSYTPLDESFVTAWNEGSDPHVTANTYLGLQRLLATRPPFLARARHEISSRAQTLSTASHTPEALSPTAAANDPLARPPSPTSPTESRTVTNGSSTGLPAEREVETAVELQQPEPTDIQKADLLITQQWLRLIVWQSSFRQQLLSWTADDESMRFAFPLAIASRTAAIIQSLPPQAIEVHGMGIFEKIFEIGTWSMNVLQACDKAGGGSGASSSLSASGSGAGGGPAMMGMDFAGASDMGVLGVGRLSFSVDPLEFFVRTLSASPNSRVQYAERLLMFANEQSGSGMRMALSPALSSPSSPEFGPTVCWASHDEYPSTATVSNGNSVLGSVLGEVADDFAMPGYARTAAAAEQAAAEQAVYETPGDEMVSPGLVAIGEPFVMIDGDLGGDSAFAGGLLLDGVIDGVDGIIDDVAPDLPAAVAYAAFSAAGSRRQSGAFAQFGLPPPDLPP